MDMTPAVPPLLRRVRRGAAPALAAAAALAALSAPAALADPAAIDRTFTSAGCGNTFVVPAGVASVHVTATGGFGVDAFGNALGGLGAIVEGDLTVTSGETITVCVGVGGGAAGAGAGGWYSGGAGGGFSSVSTVAAQWAVLAGGGGGNGGDGAIGGRGGDAGLHGGVAGDGGDAVRSSGRGGAGATATVAGVGGVHTTQPGRAGGDGSAGAGGAGGAGNPAISGSGGGGGGAGVMGGGGGAGGHALGGGVGTYGGGGGGGASRCDPIVTGCSSRLATAGTAPSVVISYAEPVLEPVLRLSATALDFGETTVGATAATQTVTVSNDGPVDIEIGHLPSFAPSATRGCLAPCGGGPGISLAGADATSFAIVSEDCDVRVLEPAQSCTIAVAFTPARAGAHAATLKLATSVGARAVALSGAGSAPVTPADPGPGPQNPPTPQEPQTPQAPQPPAPPTGGRSDDTEAPRPAAPASPARLAPAARGSAVVRRDGTVALPLACPRGTTCTVSGTLTVASGAVAGKARASAPRQQLIARFRAFVVRGDAVRTLRLRIPPRFVRAAQRSGVRTVRATLTVVTRRAGTRAVTTRERVALTLPRAAAAPQQPARRPSFTG